MGLHLVVVYVSRGFDGWKQGRGSVVLRPSLLRRSVGFDDCIALYTLPRAHCLEMLSDEYRACLGSCARDTDSGKTNRLAGRGCLPEECSEHWWNLKHLLPCLLSFTTLLPAFIIAARGTYFTRWLRDPLFPSYRFCRG
jgi:hypothetical protein